MHIVDAGLINNNIWAGWVFTNDKGSTKKIIDRVEFVIFLRVDYNL